MPKYLMDTPMIPLKHKNSFNVIKKYKTIRNNSNVYQINSKQQDSS